MPISNAVFHRRHGHHRLNIIFVTFTDNSNESISTSSIEIEVMIVRSIYRERGTKKTKRNGVNGNNRAKDVPLYQGIRAIGFDDTTKLLSRLA